MVEIEREFRLEDVTHSPAFFDIKKLAAFNGEYIRMLSLDEFVAACEPFLPDALRPRPCSPAMAPLVQTRVVTLADAAPMVDFLFADAPVDRRRSWQKAMHQPWSRSVLAETVAAYAHTAVGRRLAEGSCWRTSARRHGVKLGKAQAPVRVAVTGRTVGPPLFESLEVLGREATIERLDAAVGRLSRTG